MPGHWEGDLSIGANQASAIETLVERTSGFVQLLHLPDDHTAESVATQIILKMNALRNTLRRTLTWDQGIEMSNHAQISAATELRVYFCDPRSPWQRGTRYSAAIQMLGRVAARGCGPARRRSRPA